MSFFITLHNPTQKFRYYLDVFDQYEDDSHDMIALSAANRVLLFLLVPQIQMEPQRQVLRENGQSQTKAVPNDIKEEEFSRRFQQWNQYLYKSVHITSNLNEFEICSNSGNFRIPLVRPREISLSAFKKFSHN